MFKIVSGLAMLCVLASLSGCVSIKTYSTATQQTDVDLTTYPGGTVIKVTKQRNLPNAFGKADLLGGKVDQGFVEIRYLGKVDEARFALGIKQVTVESNETTMSRYGQDRASANMTTTTDYTGRYVTTGTVTFNKKPESRTYVLPPDYADFIWDISKGKVFEIEGYLVIFATFDQTKISYRIQKAK